jgi:hypothetical protein
MKWTAEILLNNMTPICRVGTRKNPCITQLEGNV